MNKKRVKFEKMGAIALSGLLTIQTPKVNAQIIPDNSLNTAVSCNSGICNIMGGKIAGTNLYHSFYNFSIPSFGEAYFNNANNITNIITRVTGANISNIDGKISANGSANVFLINPNGIAFGSNASLNIGGSFVATTATIMQFGNIGNFGVNTGNDVSLLTIEPSALFVNQIQAQAITNKANLQVNPGQNLVLVGNNLTVDGGNVLAPGGGGELASISNGTVGLNNDFSLNISNNAIRGDISIINNGTIDISGNGGRAINLQGNNITIENGSKVTSNNLGNLKGGDININALGKLSINNGSYIAALTFNTGDGGNIKIDSKDLEIKSSDNFFITLEKLLKKDLTIYDLKSGIFGTTFGQGNSGNLTIKTGTLTTDNISISTVNFGLGKGGDMIINADSINANKSGITAGTSNMGDSGNMTVTAKEIKLTNGTGISGATLDKGNGGKVTINATKIDLIGSKNEDIVMTEINGIPYGFGISGFFTPSISSGNAGDLTVNTDRLSLNNAQIQSLSTGTGNGGNMTINANVSINLSGFVPGFATGIFSTGNDGKAGNITLNTPILEQMNGAAISAATTGNGTGGDININANSVRLIGQGKGAEKARKIIDNDFSIKDTSDVIFSGSLGIGKAGNININTNDLLMKNGGLILSSTFVFGQGGKIQIQAKNEINISNISAIITGTTGMGNSGDLILTTPKLNIDQGSALVSGASGNGNGGNIIINANPGIVTLKGSDKIEPLNNQKGQPLFSGISFIFTDTIGQGNAGKLEIYTGKLIIGNDSQIGTGTFGKGNAGNSIINAIESVQIIGGKNADRGLKTGIFTSAVDTGHAGDLKIDTSTIIVKSGGQIETKTSASGKGGNLIINAKNNIEVSGTSPEGKVVSSLSANASADIVIKKAVTGDAGSVDIKTSTLRISDQGEITVSNDGTGKAGNLTVNADFTFLNKGKLNAETNANNFVGDINIKSILLFIQNESLITTNGVNAKGGNINIKGNFLIGITDINSKINNDITANALRNFGGRVIITAQGIFDLQFRPNLTSNNDITATSALGPQFNGEVTINTPGIDPSNGLVPLPENFTDITKQIQQGCIADKGDQFTITGRGGLPPNPQEGLRTESTKISDLTQNQLVEATNFQVDNQGKIVLIADTNPSVINTFFVAKSTCNPR